jgi:hypothetical protein
MEALSLPKSEQAAALQAITKAAVKERRLQILQWWEAQLDETKKDKDFLDYLKRSCVPYSTPGISRRRIHERAMQCVDTIMAFDL